MLALVVWALLGAALGDLVVTPEGGWFDAPPPSGVTFKSDLQNAKFRYTLSWKTLITKPTATVGTLWDGRPIQVTNQMSLSVFAFNQTVSNATNNWQVHTYIFYDKMSHGAEFHLQMNLNSAWRQIPMVSISHTQTLPVLDGNNLQVLVAMEWIEPQNPSGRVFAVGGVAYSGNYNVYLDKKSYSLDFTQFTPNSGPVKKDFFQNYSTGMRPAKTFSKLYFDSGSADSIVYLEWPDRGTDWPGSYATYLRNPFNDEIQLALGHRSAHGRFVHLMDNGQYLGVYRLRETLDNDYLAHYLGGTHSDFEYINHCRIREGNGSLWTQFQAKRGNYNLFKDLVDVPQLAEYMILEQFGLNFDVAACWNWQGSGPYTGMIDGGFQIWGSAEDLSYVSLQGGWGVSFGGPGDCWDHLWKERHPDFVQIFHDKVYKLFYTVDGPLKPTNAIARLKELQMSISQAIDAEVSRWNNYTLNNRFTTDRWNKGIQWIEKNWFNGTRMNMYFNDLKNKGQMPPANPPVYDPQDGIVPNGGFITIRPYSNWTMYCTQDGSDPRLPGGTLSPNAPSFGNAQITLQIQKSTTLSCRSRSPDGRWSPLQSSNFFVEDPELVSGKVKLTIEPVASDSSGQLIGIINYNKYPIDLLGCSFQQDGDVKYTFTSPTPIPAGELIVGTNQRLRFRQVFGYQASFFYSGEIDMIKGFRIVDPFGNTIS